MLFFLFYFIGGVPWSILFQRVGVSHSCPLIWLSIYSSQAMTSSSTLQCWATNACSIFQRVLLSLLLQHSVVHSVCFRYETPFLVHNNCYHLYTGAAVATLKGPSHLSRRGEEDHEILTWDSILHCCGAPSLLREQYILPNNCSWPPGRGPC